MATTQTSSETLMLLQSKDHGDLLDTIDDLRSKGISRYVDLPQLVVCGDQSSGKSSVLEAVSGIQFPRKDTLCTRFATEVILRRLPEVNTKISIVPASDRPEEEKACLSSFQRHQVHLDNFAALLDEAKSTMGVDDQKRPFSHDVLRVELSGPLQPHLTLVDLPGLFQASNKAQSDEDAKAVKSLVLSYMKNRRSLILAVVSANNDFANQIVTHHARKLDPNGNRTLGIITKPDALPVGSDSEKSFVELAKNKDVAFRLGWHVLRNRGYDTRDSSMMERDDEEEHFFSQGIWTSLHRRQVGIASLKPRLGALLRDQIMVEVPHLIKDVEQGVEECKAIISKLGTSRASVHEQRLYLLGVSQSFTTLIKSAVDGVNNDSFFGNASTDLGYKKRLRAVAQNLLFEFAKVMRQKGHARHIVAHVSREERATDHRLITKDEFVLEVVTLMRRSRGCELPGTYSPHIIRDLFCEQSRPWKSVVDQYADKIWNSVKITLEIIIDHISDDVTASALRRLVITPNTQIVKTELTSRITQILEPHRDGHPITYNHYFTDNIQKFRAEQRKKHLANKLDDFFGTDHARGKTLCESRSFSVVSLLNSITHDTIDNMDHYACSEAIDCMRAYYKVAIKTLIDDFASLAIERCLQSLPDLFPPEAAMALDDATISKIAAETEESIQERRTAQEKLEVLQKGLDAMKNLQRMQPTNSLGKRDEVCDEQFEESDEAPDKQFEKSDVAPDKQFEKSDEAPDKQFEKSDRALEARLSTKFGWPICFAAPDKTIMPVEQVETEMAEDKVDEWGAVPPKAKKKKEKKTRSAWSAEPEVYEEAVLG